MTMLLLLMALAQPTLEQHIRRFIFGCYGLD